MLKLKKRVREISYKSYSLSGIINTSYMREPVQFESSLERDYIYLLEFDLKVNQYLEQPLEIAYKDAKGKDRKYIPDFAVDYFNKPGEIIEIKYENILKTNFEELALKFKEAEKFCKKFNLTFKVITEKYIREERGVELENYKFLSRYRDYFQNIKEFDSVYPEMNPDINLLHEMIIKLKESTVQELVDKCSRDKNKQAELIFLTWYLVSTNFIGADFTQKLGLNSMIWNN